MMLKRQRGFTLIELMVTVAIIGILAAIAYPSYLDSVRKSRRTDAKNALTQAMANMERYYTEHNTYGTAAICGTNPLICPGSCAGAACTSTEKNYTIDLIPAPTATTFTIEATPVPGPQAVDGKMNINQANKKFHDMNNDGTYNPATENYWK